MQKHSKAELAQDINSNFAATAAAACLRSFLMLLLQRDILIKLPLLPLPLLPLPLQLQTVCLARLSVNTA